MILLKDLLNSEKQESQQGIEQSQGSPMEQAAESPTHLPSPAGTCSTSNSDNDSDNDSKSRGKGVDANVVTGKVDGDAKEGGSKEETLVCKWIDCDEVFTKAEFLYYHLCHDHVSRKSRKNLQLACHWENCKVKTEKRDHITSHLRVHVPLKPFACPTCSKRFKRPQDLKKHLKIHITSGPEVRIKKKRGPKSKKEKELIFQQQLENERLLQQRIQYQPTSISAGHSPSAEFQAYLPHELLSNCDAVTRQNVLNKMQNVLPPISNSLQSSPTYQAVPKSTKDAALLFNDLSTSMANTLRPYNSADYYQRPSRLPIPQIQSRINSYPDLRSNTAPLRNSFSIQTNYQHTTPPSTQNSTVFQNVSTLPPIQISNIFQNSQQYSTPVSNVYTTPLMNNATLQHVGVTNELPTFNSFNRETYSTTQKSAGKVENTDDDSSMVEEFNSLSVEDDLEQESDDYLDAYLESLKTINEIREYLICSMLEEDFEDEQEIIKGASSDTQKTFMNNVLPRYPKILV